jgi:spermidine dehydrogenase
MATDRELGMHCRINRRDLLNGIAVGLTAIGSGAYAKTPPFPQDQPGYYPPALDGLRGSHPGAFEAAHQLRDGAFPLSKPIDTHEHYDLVIAGAGISGLAAAHFYRARAHGSARILILDNHDDFGGHAKRNEFQVDGHRLITFGGTLSIESPFPYSVQARSLMDELGIDPVRLTAEATAAARHPYRDLKPAVFFDAETFGADRLVPGRPGAHADAGVWREFLAKTPLAPDAQSDILRVETETADYLSELSSAEKKDRLSRLSYRDFLLQLVKINPDAIAFYQTRTHDLYGVGIDAVSALDCWALGFPGFSGLHLEPGTTARMGFTPRGTATPQPPYTFHFPDGNASIARALVRSLVPEAAAGRTAEDLVTAKFQYSALDRRHAPVRIRLGSTVVLARHHGAPESAKEVDVHYVRGGRVYRLRSKRVVLACWNMMIPYLCPDLPGDQKEALKYGVKVPLVYTAVAVRNWTAFHKLGVRSMSSPGMYHSMCTLEDPTTIGNYDATPSSPDAPAVVRMRRTPCKPGLPERDQHRIGHMELLTTPFDIIERKIREQLARILGSGGFDPARDIAAITVNRWPHGYAYEYNYLFDPEWPEGQRPCEIARRRFGRIAIANSDAAAAAYTDQAIDQAYRAVEELLSS